jgi:hypothetical protein
MVSLFEHTTNMLSRHLSNDNEELDFTLYPDPENIYSPPTFPFAGLQNFETEHSDPYTFPRQESYPVTTGFDTTAMYAETQSFIESPEIRAQAPSNYSTASGASATSSAMGSPHSIHGHTFPAPERTPHGLGLNPSIVGFDDNFGQSNQYSFNAPGMEDFALDFNSAKSNGFVGEYENVTTSASRQHGSVSSNPESLSSLSTFVPSPAEVMALIPSPATSRSMASPVTPVSAVRRDHRDTGCKFPSVSFSVSPSSTHRPSQAFSANTFASSSAAGRSPISAVSQSPFTIESIPSFTTYHQSPFFSQSSGNFVPPLESSCRFPLSIQRCGFQAPNMLGVQFANKSRFRPVDPSRSVLRPPRFGNTIK